MDSLLILHNTPSLNASGRAVRNSSYDKQRRSTPNAVRFEPFILDRSLSIEDQHLRDRLDAVYRSAGEVGVLLPGTLDQSDELFLSDLVRWCDAHRVVVHAFVAGSDATNDVRATRGQKPRPSTAAFLDTLAETCESRWTVRISVFHTASEAGAQASRMLPSPKDAPAPCLAITAIGSNLNGLLDIFSEEFKNADVKIDWEVVTERPGGQVLLSFVVSSMDEKTELSPRFWKRRLERVFTTPSGSRVFSQLIVEELEGVESAEDIYSRPRGNIVSVRASSEAVVGAQHKLTSMIRADGGNVTSAQVRPFRAKSGLSSNSIAISYDDGAMSRDQARGLKQRLEKSDEAFYRVPTVNGSTKDARKPSGERQRK